MTTRATTAIAVDGHLDETAWASAAAIGGFRQVEPVEGAPASEASEIRVLFDDNALYVGARLFDREPRGIAHQGSRRDALVEADRFTLYLDPNHDRLTGVAFTVTAAGVQRDTAISNDIVEDDSWDAVWASAVAVDAEGWTVELRIPFSQLRFPPGDRPSWGINAARVVLRKHEVSWLSPVPRNESGLASRMAQLTGLPPLRPPKHLELRPYVSGRSEWVAPGRLGDPFNDGHRLRGGAGADVKYGLASNLTLDATVNPDFGQVEVDPAVVNLTAFETFFDEKRPFFIEGSQAFAGYGKSGASVTTSFFRPDPILFYSRRIGRVPQGFASADFVDRPSSTTILGAAKLTGRTKGGWTMSAVDALTAEESASTALGLVRERVSVEPFTNYFAGRAFKELGPRAGVGLIGTATSRRLDTAALDATLVGGALVGGVDAHWFLDRRREWVIHGSAAGSRVTGSEGAVAVVQRASARYYQRPDAPHVRFDPSRTALAGWMGDVSLNRNNGNVLVNARLWGNSPGFEVNDLGFVTQTDRAGGHGLVTFRKLTPGRVFRARQVAIGRMVDLELRARVPGGWRAGGGEPAVHELHPAERHGLQLARHPRRQADARRADGDPAGHPPAAGAGRLRYPPDRRRARVGHLGRTQLRQLEPDLQRGDRVPPVAGRVALGRPHGVRRTHRRAVPAHRGRSVRHRHLRPPLRLR